MIHVRLLTRRRGAVSVAVFGAAFGATGDPSRRSVGAVDPAGAEEAGEDTDSEAESCGRFSGRSEFVFMT
jgi:hypothetical protein